MYYYEILEALYKNKIKYLLVGGLSVNLHGIPRFTQDIDIVISMDEENILKTSSVLEGLGYIPKLPIKARDLLNPEIVQDWVKNKNLKAFCFYHPQDPYKVVDIVLTSSLNFKKSYEHKVIKKLEDIEIHLISIEDLMEMKKNSGRPQDISDLEMLKQVQDYMRANND